MSVLDVGCGPGSITIDLARRVPQGYAVGVEYVPDPLDTARQLAASENITNVSFEVGAIHSLRFPDNSFDIVHAHQVLQHIGDPVRALREMRRVVKPGGLVACRESSHMQWYPESDGLRASDELFRKIARAKGGNPHPGSWMHVWAEGAGFQRKGIVKSASAWCFSTDEEREYWGGSMEERARASGLGNMALREGFATEEELNRIAQGWREWRENPDGWYAVLHGEMLCRK